MQAWVAIAVVIVLIGVAFWMLRKTDPTKTVILASSRSGKSQFTSDAVIVRSFNQPEGAVFSYSGWFSVEDFTYNYGQRRTLFTKGDCPGLYLDSTSNSFLVTIETFGAMESILISNITAHKWLHVAIVVNQYNVDVYINGTLAQHHTLTQLPKQNDKPVVIGDNTTGWDGLVSELTYYSRSLGASEIEKIAGVKPSISATMPAMPPYYDLTWYTGRLYST
jgi:hypothetical protein